MQKKWATSPESDPCKRCCCCFAWKSKYCAQTLLHRDLEIEGRDGAAAGDRDGTAMVEIWKRIFVIRPHGGSV